MNPIFSKLNDSEFQKLKDAFALITLYIAGADGSIEAEETKWAEHVTQIRSYKMTDDLIDFYKEVNDEFHEKLGHLLETLPKDTDNRSRHIADKLSSLNPILSTLDTKTGARLYKGLVSFAEHVAKSTGGLFGFFSISAAEKSLLDLKMITPIVDQDDTGEEE